jgi:drug/metabolite transporter (DMT)-like permease
VPTERSDPTGVGIVLVAASLFATLGTLSRFAYDQGLAPFAFVTWRAGIGALGLWAAILLLRGRRGPLFAWSTTSARARRALAVAVVVGAILNLAMFLAFQRTTIALALLAFYLYPAIVAAASVALGRERLDAVKLVALALALGGMVVVVLGGLGGQGGVSALNVDPLGIAAALVAAACQAVFVLVSRDYASVPTDQAMATILGGTGVVAAVVTVVIVGPAQLVAPLADPALLGLLLVVGIFAAAVPSSLFLFGIRRLGGIRTGIVMLAEPVVGVALAALFLAEGVSPLQAVGGVTILIAAFLVQRDTTADPAGAVMPAPGGP